jgi:4-aminobutyrate aminotransferase
MTETFVERSNKVISGVLGHYTSLEVESGSGCYLLGKNGKRYLDFSSGIGVTSTGHCHPKVVNAIKTQAETLIHACIGVVYYESPLRLAESLLQKMPEINGKVFFTQSGSEAVEACIKLAKYVTKKQKIIAFKGGFHGRTLGALSLTTSKEKYRHGYEPLLEGIEFFPYPYCYRCPFGADASNCGTACKEALIRYFDGIKDDVAAVIIEPVLGEGGYTTAPTEFLTELAAICKRKNILLIFDEIQSGIGKTGSWFAYQNVGVVPDIVAVAKGLASGMPLGACVAKASLMDAWTKGAHGGTYGGNPVTCAAGEATLEIVAEVLPSVAEKGQQALDFLKANLENHPFVGDIRGNGLMIGIEYVKDKTTKEPHSDFISKIINGCLEKELIVISCGIEDNVIRLVPPLIIDTPTLMEGLKRFCEVNHAIH